MKKIRRDIVNYLVFLGHSLYNKEYVSEEKKCNIKWIFMVLQP